MLVKLDYQHIGPIRKALREGATVQSIANQYGVTAGVVYRFAKRYSISVNHHPIGTGKEAQL